jgi:hypothetical protein
VRRRASARIERGTLVVSGEHGNNLGTDLVALAKDWLQASTPGLDRYRTSFTREPIGKPALHATTDANGPWMIRRMRNPQRFELRAE